LFFSFDLWARLALSTPWTETLAQKVGARVGGVKKFILGQPPYLDGHTPSHFAIASGGPLNLTILVNRPLRVMGFGKLYVDNLFDNLAHFENAF
jgi:hypothetical protein